MTKKKTPLPPYPAWIMLVPKPTPEGKVRDIDKGMYSVFEDEVIESIRAKKKGQRRGETTTPTGEA